MKIVSYICIFAIALSTLLLGVNELSVAKMPYLAFLSAVVVICAIILIAMFLASADPLDISKDY